MAKLLNQISLEQTHISGPDHFVQFYDKDPSLFDTLAVFISTGLIQKDACIVIATKIHRKKLEERLVLYGVNISEIKANGLYQAYDAAETLSQFMIDGEPNAQRFNKVIGGLIRTTSKNNLRIRAFGEMVALLWKDGNHTGAIKLEKLWNSLAKTNIFSLFCAYPMSNFETKFQDSFMGVGLEHTKVIPAESYTRLNTPENKLREIALLQQRSASLEAEISERKRLEKHKDEFVAVASHELKTPVTSLKGYTHILAKKAQLSGDASSLMFLNKMDAQLDKLNALIGDLLDVARSDNGKLHFHNNFFDLNDLVNEITEQAQQMSEKHKIILKLNETVPIFGDRDRVGQVITNLLTNAIKYSPETQKIIVTTSRQGNVIDLCVKDFGIGVSKEDINKLFKRFFRVAGVREKTYPGMGVGLYLSSEIVKRHKGKMWVKSVKGKGSSFYFSLPLKKIA